MGFSSDQKLDSRDFWLIANSVLNKGKSVKSPLFNGSEMLASASHKARLLADNFKKSHFDDSCILLHVFPSRTYQELSSWLKRSKPTLIRQGNLVLIIFQ